MDDVHALVEGEELADSIVQLNCGHKMHMECLKGWINSGSNMCPGRCMPPIAPESEAQAITVDPYLPHAFRDNDPSEDGSEGGDDMQVVQARINERAASRDPTVRALAAQQQETLDRVREEQQQQQERLDRVREEQQQRRQRRLNELRQQAPTMREYREIAEDKIEIMQQYYRRASPVMRLLRPRGTPGRRRRIVTDMRTIISLLSDQVLPLIGVPATSQSAMKEQADTITKFYSVKDRVESDEHADTRDYEFCNVLNGIMLWSIFFGVVDIERKTVRPNAEANPYLSPELKDTVWNDVGEATCDIYPEYSHFFRVDDDSEIRGGAGKRSTRTSRTRHVSTQIHHEPIPVVNELPRWMTVNMGLVGLTMIMAVMGA
jgi:hypothetical protein